MHYYPFKHYSPQAAAVIKYRQEDSFQWEPQMSTCAQESLTDTSISTSLSSHD